MKWSEWLEKWSMTSLKITAPFLEMEWSPKDEDRDAAWELYVELLTRITTQPLASEHGDEATALESIHRVFGLTRDVIKRHGRQSIEFTKIAIVMLNQKIRPFTAKWHELIIEGAFEDLSQCIQFRKELEDLRQTLCVYTRMLSDMAGVEDLTQLEAE